MTATTRQQLGETTGLLTTGLRDREPVDDCIPQGRDSTKQTHTQLHSANLHPGMGSFLDGFWRRLQFILGPERFAEGVREIVPVLKIVPGVLFGFLQQAILHHVEDDLAKVAGMVHAPFLEDRGGHRAVLLQRVLPNAFQQFLAGNVLARRAFVFAGDQFLGEVERFAREMIGVAREPGVVREHRFH